jgi:hypothetical protein
MPKINIEILRTVEITRDERIEVEVEVPAHLLGEDAEFDALENWVDAELKKTDSELTRACVSSWDIDDESESVEINEVTNLDEG